MTALLLLAGGVLLISVGADRLVAGAASGAARLGIAPLVVGLTVVAFGTSAPEVVLTVLAVGRGQGDVAVGNLIGSNIFNVLFILGAAALVTPLGVARQLIRVEVPLLIAASVAVVGLARDGWIGRADGLILLVAFVVYLVAMLRQARGVNGVTRDDAAGDPGVPAPVPAPAPAPPAGGAPGATRGGALADLLRVAAGFVLLVAGAQALIAGAVGVARLAGASELVIGLTVLAAGTSLPEVATSLAAARRRESDIAVGNAIGSSIFNLLFVLGLGAVLAPEAIAVPPAAQRFDLLVMTATAVACLPIFLTGHRIDRWEGVVFLGYYAGYVSYLGLDASGHEAAGALRTALSWFVAPLALVTAGVVLGRWRAARRRPVRRPGTRRASIRPRTS
ncbi:MAG: calcium/sodium antiporter [Vicinamibacterales bacterium]